MYLECFCGVHASHMGAWFAPRNMLPRGWPSSGQRQLVSLLVTSVQYSCYILTTMDFLLPFCYYNRVIHSFLSLSLFLKKSFPPHLCLGMYTLLLFPHQLWLSSLFDPFFLIYKSSH